MQSLGCVRLSCQCGMMQTACEPSQLDVAEQNDVLTNTRGGRQEEYSKEPGTEMIVEWNVQSSCTVFWHHLKNVNARFSSHLWFSLVITNTNWRGINMNMKPLRVGKHLLIRVFFLIFCPQLRLLLFLFKMQLLEETLLNIFYYFSIPPNLDANVPHDQGSRVYFHGNCEIRA